MSLTGDARAQSIYNAISSTPNFALLNDGEKATLLAQLKVVYGADTAYLVGNTVVTPSALKVAPGQAVTTPSGAGSTTSIGTVTGQGSIT